MFRVIRFRIAPYDGTQSHRTAPEARLNLTATRKEKRDVQRIQDQEDTAELRKLQVKIQKKKQTK
jgi:hypothetical protein